MKKSIIIILCLISSILSDPDPNFYVFIGFGQSNMEGNDGMDPEDLENIPENFLMMPSINQPSKNREAGKWYSAFPPLNRESQGICPLDYFGRTLAEKYSDKKIGVINVSIGGSSIDVFDEDKYEQYIATSPDWYKGITAEYGDNPLGILYERAKSAQNDGVIKGILLHQGETNAGDVNWPNNVKKIYERMLEVLGLKAEEVPLLVGEVVTEEMGGTSARHNAIIDTMPDIIPTAHVVKSDGCPCRGDGAHFSKEGYRMIGKRYAEVMIDLL